MPNHPLIDEVLQHVVARGDEWYGDFEDLRDKLHELPSEHVTELIPLAREDGPAQEVFASALGDMAHPEAAELYLSWLDTNDETLKLNGAFALSGLLDGAVDTSDVINGGHIDAAELERVAAALRSRWATSPPQLASHSDWVAARARAPKYTEFEKRLNLIELNPQWALLGSGVFEIPDGPLPANVGHHLVGAEARFEDGGPTTFVVVQLDSATGEVAAAYQKVDKQWIDVTATAVAITPAHEIARAKSSRASRWFKRR